MGVIVPFPNPVADVLEHYARLARAGVIKGVIIAATTGDEPLVADAGVDIGEMAALITELQDARLFALIDEQ